MRKIPRSIYVMLLITALGLSAFAGGTSETIGAATGDPVPPPSSLNGKFQKPSTEVLKSTLNKWQFEVTQNNATEYPFTNIYWINYEDGIYVDIVSGEALFSSRDQYDSGTGWPSFTKPLEPGNVIELTGPQDRMNAAEVRSFFADSHLGHVFTDGPEPTGLRYCMNSAAMRFVRVDKLAEEGYSR